jgi:curved DNA-binding protein CbpA
MTDLYAVLGLASDADASTIRAAYRTLARSNHPDVGGDPHAMIRINEAWRILGNPERRTAYDASIPAAETKPRQYRDGVSVLDFGRYEGWSLSEVAAYDEDYLDWLGRTPAGRPYQAEIQVVLSRRASIMETLRPQARHAGLAWNPR